ncbi:DUF3144 domain-containing protein [Cellvibrio sp. NN19]|uniref:DUF3144 domain-containing protein n=1 Tax=Cellvibrio chitinivorans TaxID=3102792 RepID=UPI002B4153F3|nr:DUF3144 domain-containing protein [Cellvibrio sp. NN19]
MSNKSDDDLFWELVEKYIDQANDDCETADPGIVSAALMNAAARFNAYVVAQSSLDKNEFAEDVEGTTNYLTGRYRDFLKEHMDDYRENYTTLIGNRELPEE